MDILDMVYAVTGLLVSAGFSLVLLALISLRNFNASPRRPGHHLPRQ